MKKFLLATLLSVAALLSPAASSLTGLMAKSGEDSSLRVVSFNIRNGEANDGTNSWIYRYPASVLMVREIRPDIMGLQEAYEYQVNFLSENLRDYKCVGVGREDGKHEGEHMSIFYNKKTVSLKKWGTFWLSETPDEPSLGWDGACRRTATWALMKDKRTGHKFIYVNTHLDHVGKTAQRNGLNLIMEKVAELNPDNLPVVLTGDFNVEPDDSILKALDGKMTSARDVAVKTDRHGTYNDWGKASSVIDYIYFAGFSSCPEFRTVTEKFGDWQFVSDHYPVTAVLIF